MGSGVGRSREWPRPVDAKWNTPACCQLLLVCPPAAQGPKRLLGPRLPPGPGRASRPAGAGEARAGPPQPCPQLAGSLGTCGRWPGEVRGDTRRRNNDGKQPDCVHLELQTAQDNQYVAFSSRRLFSQSETLYYSLLKPLTPRRLPPGYQPRAPFAPSSPEWLGQGERSRPCLP